MTTGARDLVALGIAVAGLVVVGPISLFMPEGAVGRFGQPAVWLMLIVFYALCVASVVLLSRPRLVIYNISAEQLRPVMARVAAELDGGARWAGESLYLPRLCVQLHIDYQPSMRNASLVSNGEHQNLDSWRQIEVALKGALADVRSSPNPWGAGLVGVAGLLAACAAAAMFTQPAQFALEMHEMLGR